MNTTTTTTTNYGTGGSFTKTAELYVDAMEQLAMYEELLAVATNWQHTFEIGRMTRCVNEWDTEAVRLYQELIDIGANHGLNDPETLQEAIDTVLAR